MYSRVLKGPAAGKFRRSNVYPAIPLQHVKVHFRSGGGRVGIYLMRKHGNQREVAFLKYPDARVQPLRLEKYEVNIVFFNAALLSEKTKSESQVEQVCIKV